MILGDKNIGRADKDITGISGTVIWRDTLVNVGIIHFVSWLHMHTGLADTKHLAQTCLYCMKLAYHI